MEDYLDRTMRKADALEQAELSMRARTAAATHHLARVLADLEQELASLEQELTLLDAETKQAAQRVKIAVAHFRTVVKRKELLRLQQRIDNWKPEQLISRDQFEKML